MKGVLFEFECFKIKEHAFCLYFIIPPSSFILCSQARLKLCPDRIRADSR